jgi:hypothetical protein
MTAHWPSEVPLALKQCHLGCVHIGLPRDFSCKTRTACCDGRRRRCVHTGPARPKTRIIRFATLSFHWIKLLHHVPLATISYCTYRDVTRTVRRSSQLTIEADSASTAGWLADWRRAAGTNHHEAPAHSYGLSLTAPGYQPLSQGFRSFQPLTAVVTPHSTVLLEKLTGSQLVKKFPPFYGTRKFIIALTSTCQLYLP